MFTYNQQNYIIAFHKMTPIYNETNGYFATRHPTFFKILFDTNIHENLSCLTQVYIYVTGTKIGLRKR